MPRRPAATFSNNARASGPSAYRPATAKIPSNTIWVRNTASPTSSANGSVSTTTSTAISRNRPRRVSAYQTATVSSATITASTSRSSGWVTAYSTPAATA